MVRGIESFRDWFQVILLNMWDASAAGFRLAPDWPGGGCCLQKSKETCGSSGVGTGSATP